MVLVLMAVGAFTSVDSQALGLTLQSIKIDLRLNDTQLGLLTGMAFALFYSIMGIPLARWADRGNRVRIIALSTALYAIAMALCGAASGFVQLMLIRIGVAVGEAGYFPATNSLLADHFSRAERPRALAFTVIGTPLSVLVGYLLAGRVNELYGWRLTFALLGIPGLLLALITLFSLDEPRTGRSSEDRPGSPVEDLRDPAAGQRERLAVEVLEGSGYVGLREVAATLWSKRTFRCLLCGFSALSFFGGGIAQWQPAFLIRSFGLSTGAMGPWLAVIYGTGGLIGTWWSGQWASRYAANNEEKQLKGMAIACLATGMAATVLYLSVDQYCAFALMWLSAIGFAVVTTPLFAIFQTLVPARMRAVSIAFIYLVSNLVGLGLGPLTVGTLSDALRPLFAEESLRYALVAMTPGYLWAGWYLWRARKTVASELSCSGEPTAESPSKESGFATDTRL